MASTCFAFISAWCCIERLTSVARLKPPEASASTGCVGLPKPRSRMAFAATRAAGGASGLAIIRARVSIASGAYERASSTISRNSFGRPPGLPETPLAKGLPSVFIAQPRCSQRTRPSPRLSESLQAPSIDALRRPARGAQRDRGGAQARHGRLADEPSRALKIDAGERLRGRKEIIKAPTEADRFGGRFRCEPQGATPVPLPTLRRVVLRTRERTQPINCCRQTWFPIRKGAWRWLACPIRPRERCRPSPLFDYSGILS